MERFLWIYCGGLMESLLREHPIDVDLLSMIEDLFWGREWEEDLMDASKFRQCRRSWRQKSQSHRKPYFLMPTRAVCVYSACTRGLAVYRVHVHACWLCTGSMEWIKLWRFLFELVPSSWMRQVPDLHSMASDLSLRHWYGYIIILMDTIVWCIMNS